MFDEYFELQQKIYDYFGFVEDWAVLPLDDRRCHHWMIVEDKRVQFGKKEDILNDSGDCYEDEIYTQRFYSKWVYRAKDYTMIMVDTHTDGNRFLAIFDNTKEIKQS